MRGLEDCGWFRHGQALMGLLVLIPSLAFLEAGHTATPRTLVADVERISDGDTLVAVSENKTKLRIRLLGIDAPEVPHGKKPGQPFGGEARDYLDHLIRGKTVQVETYGPDRWKKRVLAVIFDGQVNINLLMVAMGYAEVYRGTPCRAYCRELEEAEAKARRDRVGMWAQGATHESPGAFRQRLKIRGD